MSIVDDNFCDPARVRSLRDYLLTSLGPRGSHKAFVGSTGHLSLTATSRRVLRLLELQDPCCESVLHASSAFLETNNGSDGGTYYAALLCELTCMFRSLDRPEEASEVLQEAVRKCFEQSRLAIDWGSAGSVAAVLRTVLSSKPWLSKKEVTPLAVSMVKGFLNTLPGDNGLLQAKVVHGAGEESRLFPGVLHS